MLSSALAQIPDDTLAPDSLAEDTVDYTARFLEAQGQVALRVPVLERVQPPGPHSPFSRTVFTRDAIEWGHARLVCHSERQRRTLVFVILSASEESK